MIPKRSYIRNLSGSVVKFSLYPESTRSDHMAAASRPITDEMKEYTLGLVLFDMVPVLLFLMSGLVIHSMYDSRLLLAGVAASFLGGTAKVIWKLIVVLGRKDRPVFNRIFRALMPAGFLLMILSVPAGGKTAFISLWHSLTMMPALIFFILSFAGMCLMGYLGSHLDKSASSNWREEITNALAQAALLAGVIVVYFGSYYHAGDAALTAMKGTDTVSVTAAEYGYYFDGPGTDDLLIFYPGAKVEASSYAPLLLMLAEDGTDCRLCEMPHGMALLGKDYAEDIRAEGGYSRWYLAGHSLGGATAAMLAEDEENDWDGLILLAAYPTGNIQEPVLSIYGSEDEVLNQVKYEKSSEAGYWPEDFEEFIIEGGNHAQFGDYGIQKGDGAAAISAEEQQKETAGVIESWISGAAAYSSY